MTHQIIQSDREFVENLREEGWQVREANPWEPDVAPQHHRFLLVEGELYRAMPPNLP
jgi:hypothetical protein